VGPQTRFTSFHISVRMYILGTLNYIYSRSRVSFCSVLIMGQDCRFPGESCLFDTCSLRHLNAMDGKFEARLSDDSAHDAKDKILIPNCFTSGGIRFHPGVEALSSIEDPSGNASESGSCNAPLEKNDAMKVWQEMKQNGFLSLPACKPAPRKDVTKRKHDMASRKKKVAKIEQVNRFTKVAAAPNGLLGELNPGIINRLRNSNQVYSLFNN
jgi:hypothetical protein